ncbi:MAG: hypothetical protein WC364_15350 [Eubacteriales bacterium]
MKKLTSEQREVVTSLDRRGHIKVYALAGTGKTAALKAIAEVHPCRKILYPAFSRRLTRKPKSGVNDA